MERKKIWEKIKEASTRNDEEEEKREERRKFISRVQELKDDLIYDLDSASETEKMQIALMLENTYTQSKITQASQGLKWATWVLAGATIIFTWVNIVNSPYTSEIWQTLRNIGEIMLFVFVGFIAFVLVKNAVVSFVRWIIKLIKNRKRRKKETPHSV